MRNKVSKTTLLAFAIALLTIAFIVAMLISGIMNESNRIDEGIIIDKHFQSAYTRYSSDKNSGHLYSTPDIYTFTIEGTKDGKTVRYTFEVTQDEYVAYKIGDYYKR